MKRLLVLCVVLAGCQGRFVNEEVSPPEEKRIIEKTRWRGVPDSENPYAPQTIIPTRDPEIPSAVPGSEPVTTRDLEPSPETRRLQPATVSIGAPDKPPVVVVDGHKLVKKPEDGWYYFEGTDVRAMFLTIGDNRILGTSTRMIDGEEHAYDPVAKTWSKTGRKPSPPLPKYEPIKVPEAKKHLLSQRRNAWKVGRIRSVGRFDAGGSRSWRRVEREVND